MLRHQQSKDQSVRITLPDGSTGFIFTDRRCNVTYDFPRHIKIEVITLPNKTQGDNP